MVDNQKSLLITGGLGFIGFNYLLMLFKKEASELPKYVINLDNETYAASIWKRNEGDKTSYSELTNKVKKYYNNGIYQKKTDINFTNDTANELAIYFHTGNAPILNRTTYFNGNTLLMGDIDGTFKNVNSGYGTVNKDNIKEIQLKWPEAKLGDMTHFTFDGNKRNYN